MLSITPPISLGKSEGPSTPYIGFEAIRTNPLDHLPTYQLRTHLPCAGRWWSGGPSQAEGSALSGWTSWSSGRTVTGGTSAPKHRTRSPASSPAGWQPRLTGK